MDGVLKTVLLVIGAIAALAGLVIVYAAPSVVDRKGLAAKRKVDPSLFEHLPPEEIEKYRRNGAILDLKIKGVALAIPGMLLIVFTIR